jgi:hypothetical protein
VLVERGNIQEDMAAGLVSTVAINGGQEQERARLFDDLVDAVRLLGGTALHKMRRATVIAGTERASYGGGLLKVQPGHTCSIQHELGHALEYARSDLAEAAAALLERRKICFAVGALLSETSAEPGLPGRS